MTLCSPPGSFGELPAPLGRWGEHGYRERAVGMRNRRGPHLFSVHNPVKKKGRLPMDSDDVKAQLGKNATAIWLIGGVILFLVDGGFSHLFSLRAAAFLVIGMFAAAIIVGIVSYFIINAMATRLSARYPDPSTPDAQVAMRTWRNVFSLINVVLAALFVLGAYASFFWY